MSQNTLVIADGTGAQVLERMNNSNNTLATLNSGSSAPATTYAHMLWADTTNNQLKMRNAANTGWNVVGSFDATTFYPSISTGLITEDKIATGAVTETKLGTGAVTETKIADLAVTNSKFADGSISNAKLATPFTAGTAWGYSGVSVSSINFTDIPSWVRKITICAGGMSTLSTSGMTIRVGTSTGYRTADYIGASDSMGTGVAPHAYSTGFDVGDTTQGAGDHRSFTAILSKPNSASNYWTFSLMGANTYTTNSLMLGGGAIFLGGSGTGNILNSIRVTTLNGTDVFDGGNVNIFYEG